MAQVREPRGTFGTEHAPKVPLGSATARTTFGVPARPETLAERREFLSAGFTPLACATCGTSVLVKKNSSRHTSIQWTCDPAAHCPRYAERTDGVRTALPDTCERLSETIARAAAEGRIEVGHGD